MTILYAAIARGATVLCSHQVGSGNYEMVMSNVLPNIPTSEDAKTSYTSTNNLTFHVMVEGGLVYLCASESDFGKRQPYAFLNEIRHQFMSGSLAHRAQYAVEGELDRDFQPVLATQMERFSQGSGNDQITTLQSQVEEVKGIMTQNIENILERGQRLEDLMDKTTDLEANERARMLDSRVSYEMLIDHGSQLPFFFPTAHAATFKKSSHRVRRKMWWRSTRWTIVCVLVVIVIIGILILIILFSTHVLPVTGGGDSTTTTTTTVPSLR